MANFDGRPAHFPITAYYKGDFAMTFSFTSGGSPYTLTGATATFIIYERNGTAALSLSSGSGLTITAAAGTIDLDITNAQIVALATQSYMYEFIVTLSGGTVWPVLDGAFVVSENGQKNYSGSDVTVALDGNTVTLTIVPTAGGGGGGGGDVSDGDTLATGLTFPNNGLHLLDTNGSHDLIVSPGSDLTADRTLTVTTGDADRTLTLSDSTTLGGGSHSGTNTGDVTLSGTPDYITISGQVITRNAIDPTTDVSILTAGAGEQLTVNEAGTALEFGLASKYLPVRKGSVGTITAGTPVYMTGYNPSGFIEVETADQSDPAKMPAVGIAFDALTNSTTARVLMFGRMQNLDTSAYAEESKLYISNTIGAGLPWLTATKPTTGLIQAVATVVRQNANNGSIVVHGASRSNDIPNFSAADKYWYGGTGGQATEGDITAFGRSLLDDANAAAGLATLGAAASSHTHAFTDITSGTVAAGLTATLTSTSSINFRYSSTNSAVLINDTAGVYVRSADGTGAIDIENGGVSFDTGVSSFYIDTTAFSVSAPYIELDNSTAASPGILRFLEPSGLNYFSIQAQAMAGNNAYIWPAADAAGALTSDGAGNLTWTAVGGGSPSIISPAQITADQDDYSPTGWSSATIVRLSGDSGFRAITSMAAGSSGEEKTLINVGSYCMYLPGEHPDGTAANRITGLAKDYILFPGTTARIVYDGTSSRWRITDAMAKFEDYRTLYYQWSAGSSTAADWGDWGFGTSGGSTGSSTVAAGRPACFIIGTSTSTTGAAWTSQTKNADFFYPGDGHMFSEFVWQLADLSDGTETYTAYFLIDANPNSGTLNNNSVGVRYSHGVNSGKLEGFSKDTGGTESTVDLGVTVAATTIYKVRVELDKAISEVRFYVDGAFAGRVTGNMPTAIGSGTKALILKSAGTTNRQMYIHAMASGGIFP